LVDGVYRDKQDQATKIEAARIAGDIRVESRRGGYSLRCDLLDGVVVALAGEDDRARGIDHLKTDVKR
jgi:hypothetical protein